MKNIYKMSSDELRARFGKAITVGGRTNKFDYLIDDIAQELDRRNRAKIYKAACKYIKNDGENQFKAAGDYADAVLKDDNYFCTLEFWEISKHDCKYHHPITVDL